MGADPSLVLNYWGFLPPTLTFTRSVATDASGSTSRLRAASLSAAPAGDHKKYPQLRGGHIRAGGNHFPRRGVGQCPTWQCAIFKLTCCRGRSGLAISCEAA